jgi:hypothetical protein
VSKERKRRYDTMSFSLSRDVAEMIEDFARLTGWSKSRCVEEFVRYAYPVLKKRFAAFKERREREEETEREEEVERLRQEYWRRVYLGQIRQEDWEPAWWPV